jgi:hypothetical protein
MKVRCIDAGTLSLTEGKIYEVEYEYASHYAIRDDNSAPRSLYKSRFEVVEEQVQSPEQKQSIAEIAGSLTLEEKVEMVKTLLNSMYCLECKHNSVYALCRECPLSLDCGDVMFEGKCRTPDETPQETPKVPDQTPTPPPPEPTPRQKAIDAVAKVEALLCDLVSSDVIPCKYCAISCVVNFRPIPEAPEPPKEVEFAEAFKLYYKVHENRVMSLVTGKIFDQHYGLSNATHDEIDGKWRIVFAHVD